MGNNPIFEQVTVLFFIMIVGMIAAKLNIIDGHVRKKLSDLLLYITSPFLVTASFNFEFSTDMLKNAGIVLAFAIAIHFFAVFLGMILFAKYSPSKQKVLKFILVFSNCGFMGFPILESMFGKIGVFYGSIYNVVFQGFIWTYGVILFTGNRKQTSLTKVLLHPGVISVFVGMILFLFSIKLPSPILNTLELVGGMTAPLSMLIVGALLAEADFRTVFSGLEVYYGSIVRLIIIPIITIIALKLIGLDKELLRVCVLLIAMPAAANTVIFAEKYDADSILASRCVALSTIFSIITIPIIMMLA